MLHPEQPGADPAPLRGAAAVDDGGAQISNATARVVEPVPGPVQSQERVLHDVLGRSPVPDEQ